MPLNRTQNGVNILAVLASEDRILGSSLFGFLFDVGSRTRIVAQADDACEAVHESSFCREPTDAMTSRGQDQDAPVQAVTDGNVEGFAKDTVPLLRVRDDLGVATRDVEDDRGWRRSDESAHFDVCNLLGAKNQHRRGSVRNGVLNGLYLRPTQ